MKLLDLFCGAGGCSVGYYRAGFDITGVDITAHNDYPYPLIVADALDVLNDREYLNQFDVIHASPPCPFYSVATRATKSTNNHPDLVPTVRELLKQSGRHYVIENVVGAPMHYPIMLCGWAMGIRHLPRHRLFESDLFLMSPGCACPGRDDVSIFGHSGEDRRDLPIVNERRAQLKDRPTRKRHPAVRLADAKNILGVEWMTDRSDVSDAIPPAYTEYVGGQLADQL